MQMQILNVVSMEVNNEVLNKKNCRLLELYLEEERLRSQCWKYAKEI